MLGQAIRKAGRQPSRQAAAAGRSPTHPHPTPPGRDAPREQPHGRVKGARRHLLRCKAALGLPAVHGGHAGRGRHKGRSLAGDACCCLGCHLSCNLGRDLQVLRVCVGCKGSWVGLVAALGKGTRMHAAQLYRCPHTGGSSRAGAQAASTLCKAKQTPTQSTRTSMSQPPSPPSAPMSSKPWLPTADRRGAEEMGGRQPVRAPCNQLCMKLAWAGHVQPPTHHTATSCSLRREPTHPRPPRQRRPEGPRRPSRHQLLLGQVPPPPPPPLRPPLRRPCRAPSLQQRVPGPREVGWVGGHSAEPTAMPGEHSALQIPSHLPPATRLCPSHHRSVLPAASLPPAAHPW